MAADTPDEYCKGCARNENGRMVRANRGVLGKKKKKRTITVHSALHFCTRLLIAVRPTIPGWSQLSGNNGILLRTGCQLLARQLQLIHLPVTALCRQ
ncbi:hypothetical protein FDW89_05730 [Citrobacter sp. wls830]|nr:hypothetical protein FDW89_05730 [Citrobacter sp. wls830]